MANAQPNTRAAIFSSRLVGDAVRDPSIAFNRACLARRVTPSSRTRFDMNFNAGRGFSVMEAVSSPAVRRRLRTLRRTELDRRINLLGARMGECLRAIAFFGTARRN